MPTTAIPLAYTAKKWSLSGLEGISDRTLETHFHLYEGYVEHVNLLNEQLTARVEAHTAVATDMAFAEIERRLGFEYNGMRLHEYYFDNLRRPGGGASAGAKLDSALRQSYGDFSTWQKAFSAVGAMRGVGWAIRYQDPTSGRLSNHWITLHEVGNVAGFVPILVMDVWEHAYMLDYKPSDRGKYIEAFFANVDWDIVEARLADALPS